MIGEILNGRGYREQNAAIAAAVAFILGNRSLPLASCFDTATIEKPDDDVVERIKYDWGSATGQPRALRVEVGNGKN